jgi:hypothetical protein
MLVISNPETDQKTDELISNIYDAKNKAFACTAIQPRDLPTSFYLPVFIIQKGQKGKGLDPMVHE